MSSSQQTPTDLSGNKTDAPVAFPAGPNTLCYRCGRRGHFSSTCRVKKHIKGHDIESDTEYDSDKYY
jgi:hypothetical protein